MKVSLEIQSPSYFTSQEIIIQEFLKQNEVLDLEKTLQTVKVMVFSSGKHTR
jgi:hypothetical protein